MAAALDQAIPKIHERIVGAAALDDVSGIPQLPVVRAEKLFGEVLVKSHEILG